jgi:uncharacterized protein (DUF58 family)
MTLGARVTQRAVAWSRRRQGEDAFPVELRARRLYILPTRTGIAFGLLLFLMLVAGMNYSNSMALMLTFVLGAWATVGMVECQRTLRGLVVLQGRAGDAFAGGGGRFSLQLCNPTRIARHSLGLRCPGSPAQDFELPAHAELWVTAAFEAGPRGRQRLDRLELATLAPFGLFRAWTWLYLPIDAIVYPRPAGERALPRSGAWHQSHSLATTGRDPGQWAGLRPYAEGDSPRSIAWKAWARGGPLLVGQYEGEGGDEHLLDEAMLRDLPVEARLAQLAAWVEACSRDGSAFALELAGLRLPLDHGSEQRTAALRALALHDAPKPGTPPPSPAGPP